MADTTLDALAAVRAQAEPVNEIGRAFMLHPATAQIGAEAGYTNPVAFYMAGRGGVLGDVDADVVVAAFGFFEPTTVRSLWDEGIAVEGARAAGHRYAEACAAWGRAHLAEVEGVDRLAELAERVVRAADVAGLPLFAGWRAEPLAADAPARAMQLCHVMREWRGSAHVVAIRAEGISPVEAVVSGSGENMARFFGWTGDLPDVAALGDRRAAAEATTDALQVPAFEHGLDSAERAEFVELIGRVHAVITGS